MQTTATLTTQNTAHGIPLFYKEYSDALSGAVLKRDLEELRRDVQELKLCLQVLQKEKSNEEYVCSCHVCVTSYRDLTVMSNEELEALLTCKILNSTVVRRHPYTTLKVKIPRVALFDVLHSQRMSHHSVYVWCNAPQSHSRKGEKFPRHSEVVSQKPVLSLFRS